MEREVVAGAELSRHMNDLLPGFQTCCMTTTQNVSVESLIPIIPLTPLPRNMLSITATKKKYRLEALGVLGKYFTPSFVHYTTLLSFCKFISPETRNFINSIIIHHVEGLDSFPAENLSKLLTEDLSGLCTVHLSLLPRNVRERETANQEWGPDTEKLLKDISQLSMRVLLELRWCHDCERFEKEYVGGKGWKVIEEDRISGRQDLKPWMPAMRKVVYQLH